jgi:hypothetical protein
VARVTFLHCSRNRAGLCTSPKRSGSTAFRLTAPDRQYRTTPLRGLFTRQKGGFYHDGRFPTLEAVVSHYDGHFKLKLTPEERRDLVEYLKSL